MLKFKQNNSFKILLLGMWLLFTSSMVAWWWFYGISQLAEFHSFDAYETERRHRMIMWEGIFFLISIFFGAMGLFYYIRKDLKQQNQLKLFFSTFTHEIKTSIARLRLQSDILKEQAESQQNFKLIRLAQDINKLDLQLENSLLISRPTEEGLFIEKINLSDCIRLVKNEWDDLSIELQADAKLLVDKRAFLAVLKNIISNSVIHGKASQIKVAVSFEAAQVVMEISDNGQGLNKNIETINLGKMVLSASQSKINGFGLYIVKQLVEQMKGSVVYKNIDQRLLISISLMGSKI